MVEKESALMTKKELALCPELAVSGCDTTALVTVSKQFAELEFETLHRHELTAAQVAAEKADWQAAGAALGKVYQALCEGENQQAMAALHTIETLIMRHGVLVPQPVLPTQTQEEVCNGQ